MKIIFGCLFLSFSMMTYANDNLTLDVNVSSPNFEVTLPANPTTGFQWSVVHYNTKLLTLSNSSYERPKTKLIGASGQMHFIFTLQKGKNYPASTDILFKYERSWEPSSATMRNIKVNFVKTDGKK
ncbi:secreted protein [Legionella santicrucis]|uniref:Secreted protein n=1 Tax=Legionella santicrucis TaxID=45074 RepID=A0A0W0ZEV8_9GAMM|nr:protease inhibitor I42 family protein [Legionella santicrucis]KTD67666.1 secreted protein [Legionella santicrucis]